MPRSAVLCAFKKKTRRFKSYHREWFDALRTKLLPRLGRTLSSSSATLADISADVSALLHHFQTYYAALDRAATPDQVPFLLSPPWRGPLVKPFLFLGDLHPYLFTNLVRSFLDDPDDEEADNRSDDSEFGYFMDFNKDGRVLEKQWQIESAWKNSSESLKPRIEAIERGLRLMVPALLDRVKSAQIRFVDRVTEDWPENDPAAVVVVEAAATETEELARVFKDANWLRQSTVSEIVGALTTYEAALFLQALAQFVVGLGS